MMSKQISGDEAIDGPEAAAPASATRLVEMILPRQADRQGVLFGGCALDLMGKAALIAASRCARGAVVLACSKGTEFRSPVRVGELLELDAQVVRIGRASMTVEVEATAETLASGARRPALRSRFEMVAVDADGRPKSIIPQPQSIQGPRDL